MNGSHTNVTRNSGAGDTADTARDYALMELDERILPGWPAHLIRKQPRKVPDDERDRALANQIINGIVKNVLLLQECIAHHSGKKLRNVEVLVQKILAIGLYQLKFLDRIPPWAAVNQAVKQTRRFRRSRATGFVNSVLRNALRQPPPLLPDPAVDPRGFAAQALSHPPQLFDKLVRLLDVEKAVQFCRHDNSEPPVLVRLYDGVDVAKLTEVGVEWIRHERAGIWVVRGARQAHYRKWASEGLAQVQDATAAGVVDGLDLHAGHRVLDRCAGRGTKTLQIRECIGLGGQIIAIDPSADRCRDLRELIHRRRVENVQVIQAGQIAQVPQEWAGPFERALLDVPCSNSGVLARRPEARYVQDDKHLASLLHLQRQILDDTAPLIAPGGLLVYSTCSIWPEENEQQVAQFLKHNERFRSVSQETTLPSFETNDPARYHDGGFVAVLRFG